MQLQRDRDRRSDSVDERGDRERGGRGRSLIQRRTSRSRSIQQPQAPTGPLTHCTRALLRPWNRWDAAAAATAAVYTAALCSVSPLLPSPLLRVCGDPLRAPAPAPPMELTASDGCSGAVSSPPPPSPAAVTPKASGHGQTKDGRVVWQPNDSSATCTHPHCAAVFTFFRRRHRANDKRSAAQRSAVRHEERVKMPRRRLRLCLCSRTHCSVLSLPALCLCLLHTCVCRCPGRLQTAVTAGVCCAPNARLIVCPCLASIISPRCAAATIAHSFSIIPAW